MTRVLASATNVTKRVRDGDKQITIVDQVNVTISIGESVALLGPSGSGKSSLLHILGGLDPTYEGSVTLLGQELKSLNDAELSHFRNKTLGFVFQNYNLLGHLSALDNVLLPARFARELADEDRAMDLLAAVGLPDKSKRLPYALSGGERQRVAIARALYHRPRMILCDEPTGNLDAETGAAVIALFATLVQDGITLLLATHDTAIASWADRTLTMRSGKMS